MKTLSEFHFDAFSDIVKNATVRAVQGLSEVIGESIQSSVLNVELVKIENVTPDSLLLENKTFGVLTQTFKGLLSAEIMLLFAQDNVFHILKKMLGDVDDETVRECEEEAMRELGNIMMNAYLSSIADTLHTPIDSAVPCYSNQSELDVTKYIQDKTNVNFVIVSHVDMTMGEQIIKGKLLFLIDSQLLNTVSDKLKHS